jgi:TM2 domain-containing membrane protein YozV
MKKFLTTSIVALMAIITLSATEYKLDEKSIDALFTNATEVAITGVDIFTGDATIANNLSSVSASDETTMKIVIAWVVDWVGLGAFGIHRYILGTKDSMWAIYTFTVCGIFGIVPTIDWFVLLIDGLALGNGDKYIDNEKFFMWAQ